MKLISNSLCFGGEQRRYRHSSTLLGCPMTVSIFVPPGDGPFPVVWFLAGLTCNDENFVIKAGAQRKAAELGLILVAPDTSPRGETLPNDESYDLGQGAGFYLTATQMPWARHFCMDEYLLDELPGLVGEVAPADLKSQGVMGHSMGGHGALTLHLRRPDRYRSCSAFAPIVAPAQVPWGQKAFTAYLGLESDAWANHDACALVRRQPSQATILIDQGLADPFLTEQLRPELFEAACAEAGQTLTLRRRDGYDHSYFFIASFIDEHLTHHAEALRTKL